MGHAKTAKTAKTAKNSKAPADFQEHLARLEEKGLLIRIDRPVCKDTEINPLVRWQFLGGYPEDQRKAFLFTNVHGAKGEKYDIPVVVGALAASNEIYAMGMGVPVEELGEVWMRGMALLHGGCRVRDGSVAPPVGYATRMNLACPSSPMRLSYLTAILTSVTRRASSRDFNASPMTRL